MLKSKNMFQILKDFFLKNYPLILLFVFVFIVYREWIIPKGYLTSGDWVFYFIEELKDFSGFPQLWQSFAGTGAVDLVPAFDVFKFLYSVLSQFVDYSLSERILYFWISLLFTPLFSFYFFSKIFKQKAAVLISVFVYNFNTYYLLLSTGHITLMVAYSFLPIIFYYFKLTLERKKLAYVFITSFFLFLSSLYEPRITYITCLILFLYFIYINFLEKYSFVELTKNTIFAFLPFVITFSLSLFWLLPIVNVGNLTTNSLFVRQLFGNEFLNILYALTFFHPFWTGANPSIFLIQEIPLKLWIIPITAFIGLMLNKNNKLIVFFGLLALVGILLTKQVAPPFTDIYLWLYNNLPGFNAFREASKFYIIIAFGYSVLLGAFIEYIWNMWKTGNIRVFSKYILTIVIAFLFLFNTKPFLLGEINSLFVQRSVPTDYLVVKDFINNQSEFFRTLWVPTGSRWTVSTSNHPEVRTIDMINGDWDKVIKHKRNFNVREGELINAFFVSGQASKLLELSSVKYVFIPLEDTINNDNFFLDYGKARKDYIDQLDKVDYLKRIDIGTQSVIVYQNEKFKKHLYITREKETIKDNISSQEISYNTVSNTEHQFTFSVKEPVYLNFSESYHPDWQVRIGDFSWFDVIFKRNYALPDAVHVRNDAGLNTFYFDPKYICQSFVCQENANGSFTISGTLYFRSQSFMYVGFIISSVTAIVILGWLVVIFGRRFYEKK